MYTFVPVSMSALPKDHTFKAVSLFSSWQFSCESEKKLKFPNLVKNTNLHSQKVHWTSGINKKKTTLSL